MSTMLMTEKASVYITYHDVTPIPTHTDKIILCMGAELPDMQLLKDAFLFDARDKKWLEATGSHRRHHWLYAVTDINLIIEETENDIIDCIDNPQGKDDLKGQDYMIYSNRLDCLIAGQVENPEEHLKWMAQRGEIETCDQDFLIIPRSKVKTLKMETRISTKVDFQIKGVNK